MPFILQGPTYKRTPNPKENWSTIQAHELIAGFPHSITWVPNLLFLSRTGSFLLFSFLITHSLVANFTAA